MYLKLPFLDLIHGIFCLPCTRRRVTYMLHGEAGDFNFPDALTPAERRRLAAGVSLEALRRE